MEFLYYQSSATRPRIGSTRCNCGERCRRSTLVTYLYWYSDRPICQENDKQIFGDFIDQYNIRQSQEDKVTLPILYEGLEARGTVTQGGDSDQLFEIVFQDKTPEERAQIKAKYATKRRF